LPHFEHFLPLSASNFAPQMAHVKGTMFNEANVIPWLTVLCSMKTNELYSCRGLNRNLTPAPLAQHQVAEKQN